MEMTNVPDSKTAGEDGEKLKGSRSGQAAMAMRQQRSGEAATVDYHHHRTHQQWESGHGRSPEDLRRVLASQDCSVVVQGQLNITLQNKIYSYLM
ncbi:hypothetical protein ROHU_019667 [Labeo rohita]|uniref:Uncharacterized protein n=1 Tax=Labeo rohita TaxID=84645 RepID=A0A498NAS9_LABRO|nr:hypothetical protein ROHU_019667 [Labeo rohita]